jgi:hypothetical protein
MLEKNRLISVIDDETPMAIHKYAIIWQYQFFLECKMSTSFNNKMVCIG